MLFQQDNRILFRFIGHYTLGCEDPLHSSLWLVLSNTSAINMQLQKLTLANELSLLPAPFYDSKDMQSLTLPFVFSARPSPAILQAAGITASWFGSLASYKGATFPVSFDTRAERQCGGVRDQQREAGRREPARHQRPDHRGRPQPEQCRSQSCCWSWAAPRRS